MQSLEIYSYIAFELEAPILSKDKSNVSERKYDHWTLCRCIFYLLVMFIFERSVVWDNYLMPNSL